MPAIEIPWQLDLIIRIVLMLVFVLITVVFLIWMVRKVVGHIQLRLGPMRTGWHGWLQSPADAVKLLTKEDLKPAAADQTVFRLAPYMVFVPSFLVFVALPFAKDVVIRSMDLGIFYIMAISSLTVVGIVMAGLGSGNKYSLLGAVRSGAQMISYELPLVLSVLGVAMVAGSLNLTAIVEQQTPIPNLVLQPLGFFIFFLAGLAELNHQPFDIQVAESEVVGGPFVEYSGLRWGMFYMSEMANLFAVSALCTLIFLGGWQWPLPGAAGWQGTLLMTAWFLAKTYVVVFVFMWVRASLPRLRIDQLMSFSWKLLIPLTFLNIFLTGAYKVFQWHWLVLFLLSLAILVASGWGLYVWRRASR
jgi:NADH-quinone oxidoreductase subunit H